MASPQEKYNAMMEPQLAEFIEQIESMCKVDHTKEPRCNTLIAAHDLRYLFQPDHDMRGNNG